MNTRKCIDFHAQGQRSLFNIRRWQSLCSGPKWLRNMENISSGAQCDSEHVAKDVTLQRVGRLGTALIFQAQENMLLFIIRLK